MGTRAFFLSLIILISIGWTDTVKGSETREIYLIVREGEKIYSITDLRNKKICLGHETHHGECAMSEAGLRRGLDYEPVISYESNFHQLTQRLMNKEMDAFFFVEQTPIYGLNDYLKHEEINILSFTDELLNKIKKYRPYEKRIITIEDYQSLKKPVLLASMKFIRVGSLSDVTGATSDLSREYALGIRDAIYWVNQTGGINGKEIKLFQYDFGYRVPDAIATYQKLKEMDRVAFILGWSIVDTEALSPYVKKDKIPFMSSFYYHNLANPKVAPYNFMVGTSDADQVRIALKYIKDSWSEKSRKPRVGSLVEDTPMGRVFNKAMVPYAKELGLEVVTQESIPLEFWEASSKILILQKDMPDYTFVHSSTPTATKIILRDARILGFKTKFLVNFRGFDETIPMSMREAAQGVIGMSPFVYFGEPVPGMKKLVEWHLKHHPNDIHTVRYVEAWVSVVTMAEGMKIADKQQNLTPEGIKRALETLTGFDTGGLTSPITFTPKDHRPNTSLKIYEVMSGALTPKTDWVKIERRKEW